MNTPPCDNQPYTGPWAAVPEILARIKAPDFPDRDYDVVKHGADPAGRADSRPAIMQAIAECSRQGGGRVVLPAGRFRVDGPIHLQDNVNLHVAQDAEILFGQDPRHYLPEVLTRYEGTIIHGYSPLIYAYRKTNIALSGEGRINGQAADSWSTWPKDPRRDDSLRAMRDMNLAQTPVAQRRFGEGHLIRPSMVEFYECRNVLIEDVTVLDSPFWCIHPVFSSNITVRRVKFDTLNGNNDGIDPDSCADVHIHDVRFNNGDDCIAIKSGRDCEGRSLGVPCRDVVIQRCVFNHYTGLAIGSEAAGGVRRVFAEQCRADGLVKRGVFIKSNRDRGGEIADIHVRDLSIKESTLPVLGISAWFGKNTRHDHPPRIHNVVMENIRAAGPCRHGIEIQGHPDGRVSDVTLRNVTLEQVEGPMLIRHAERLVFDGVTVNGRRVEPAMSDESLF